jgi:hypothetical protein
MNLSRVNIQHRKELRMKSRGYRLLLRQAPPTKAVRCAAVATTSAATPYDQPNAHCHYILLEFTPALIPILSLT